MTAVVKAEEAVRTACCRAGKLGPGLVFVRHGAGGRGVAEQAALRRRPGKTAGMVGVFFWYPCTGCGSNGWTTIQRCNAGVEKRRDSSGVDRIGGAVQNMIVADVMHLRCAV
jgi:hypothetical protein